MRTQGSSGEVGTDPWGSPYRVKYLSNADGRSTHIVVWSHGPNSVADTAEENIAAIAQKVADLDAEFKSETAILERSLDPQTEELGKVSLKPKKVNIDVKLVALAWAPYWLDAQGGTKPAWS